MNMWIGIGIIVVLLLSVSILYNRLVTKRNRVHNAWAQIDVQLKRRHDLIPNLLNTVKGYMQHERTLLETITQLRQAALATGDNVAARAEAEEALSRATRTLVAVAEAYPDLKASQTMLVLQEELSSSENKIAFARQFYNDAVLDYNTARETFPSNIFTALFGFQAATLFLVEDANERAVPNVQWS